jgi:hypothetical protein
MLLIKAASKIETLERANQLLKAKLEGYENIMKIVQIASPNYGLHEMGEENITQQLKRRIDAYSVAERLTDTQKQYYGGESDVTSAG